MKIFKSIPNENKYFVESEMELGLARSGSEGTVINIFDNIEYQEIVGFGGAFTESAAYNYSLMDDKTKKEFIKSYFSREDGIGYNVGRTHINSCDFAIDIYSYIEEGDEELTTFNIERDKKYIIPFIKDALSYIDEELFLFASPWSPPAFMKTNENVVGGGKLKDEYKKTWARYYAKYIKAYEAEGIKISGITVQNEPNADQTWESCCYSPEDEREFLEQYLIPTLNEEGLSGIKIMIWDHNKERAYDRAKEVLKSKIVNDRVWAVAHHWYSGDHFDCLRLVYEDLHKGSFCTEFCGDIDADALELAERYAKEMSNNFNNFEIGSCDWNLLLSTDGGPYHNRDAVSVATPGVVFESKDRGCFAPILYDKTKNEVIYTPVYYYIGHVSKFVKKGAKRIATSKYTDNIEVCGFKNPDNSIVLVMYNLSEYQLPAIIRKDGKCSEVTLESHSAMTVLLD